MSNSPENPTVAIVVVLFPRTRGVKQSLASLVGQTRPADLVVLLDNETSPEAAGWAEQTPELPLHYFSAGAAPLPGLINGLLEEMGEYDYVGFLQCGDVYEPTRIERCLEALNPQTATLRLPALAVTGYTVVDGEGQELPADEERAEWARRLWAPAAEGVTVSEWLGMGDFVGTVSNLFARTTHLAANPLLASEATSVYGCAILAAVQGLFVVVEEPLLRWASARIEREPTLRHVGELLAMQAEILARMRERLAESPEVRRNLTAFHRTAWNNVSGVREDLFQHLVLRLAASFPAETMEGVAGELLRTKDAQTTPEHLRELLRDAGSAPDFAAYAARNRRMQEQLRKAQADLDRLQRIAEAAQGSGWVRFGAWLGDRSARQMMEFEQFTPDAAEPAPMNKTPDAAG